MSTDETENYDFFYDEDEGEIVDWQLPLCFMKKRHKEVIEGSRPLAQTWRMKERVSYLKGLNPFHGMVHPTLWFILYSNHVTS